MTLKSEAIIEVHNAIEATLGGGRHSVTSRDRDDMIRSIIGSQALEGVHLSWDEVADIVDDVLAEPPPAYPSQR